MGLQLADGAQHSPLGIDNLHLDIGFAGSETRFYLGENLSRNLGRKRRH